MEQRITPLLLPTPEAELEASCKELDEKVTWLLHNSRKMDNYLELEPFSKDVRLCAPFSTYFVPEITYKVVRIFLAQIMAFIVAPHEKGFLLGVAQILHRITQGEEVFRNPAFAD